MPSQDLLHHLRKQMGFLERSCASFDEGFQDEAIRIAVVIRVLVHDTPKSTSLLTQLGIEDLHLRTTCPLIPENIIHFTGGLSTTRTTITDSGEAHFSHIPNLDEREPKRLLIPWKYWGKQVIYRLMGKNITRMQIVLGAANKDGGAHVDERLTSEYQAIRSGVVNVSVTIGDVETGGPVPDNHLSDLRQMGHEVLTTPQLLAML